MPTKKARIKLIRVGEPLDLPPEMLASMYSAESLKKKHPEKYEGIVYGLSLGLARAELAKMYQCDPRVVTAVLAENQVAIKGFRKSVSAQLKFSTLNCIKTFDKAVENGEVDPNKLPLAIAILIDKSDKLDNMPDVVIEHRKSDQTILNYLEKWQKDSITDIDSELIDHEKDNKE